MYKNEKAKGYIQLLLATTAATATAVSSSFDCDVISINM